MVSDDVDTGATETWSGNADSPYGNFAITAAGAWTYTLDPAAADSLAEGTSVTESFLVTVTDDKGATDTETVTITITGTNDKPTIVLGAPPVDVLEAALPTGTNPSSTAESTTGTLILADVDGLANLSSVSFDGAPSVSLGSVVGSTFNTANGTVHIDSYNSSSGVLSYTFTLTSATSDTPNGNPPETNAFTVSVKDVSGATSAPATVTITIVDDTPNHYFSRQSRPNG